MRRVVPPGPLIVLARSCSVKGKQFLNVVSRDMLQTFERSGVRFEFPAGWVLDFDDAGNGWTVTVQSPDTAFAMLSLRPDADTPSQVADEALDALRAEYQTLDAQTAVDSLAGQPAVGHDIDFITLDTSIVCWTRCVATANGPLLILCQVSEFDRSRHEASLRALGATLRVED